jgi:hypothetical protein
MLKKKFGPIFKELYNFLPKKLSLCSQKYGFGIQDPRSGILKNLFRILDPGVEKAPDPGSESPTLIKTVRFGCYKNINISIDEGFVQST